LEVEGKEKKEDLGHDVSQERACACSSTEREGGREKKASRTWCKREKKQARALTLTALRREKEGRQLALNRKRGQRRLA